MQKPHYAEVPGKEPIHNFDVKQKIVPVDLERLHNQRNKLDYITLRLKFILPLAFIIASFALIVIMLLLSVARNPGDATSAIGVLETISYISQSNPVIEIKTITGSQICDSSVFEPGSLGTWRALDYGCYCQSRNVLDRRLCDITEAGACQNVTRLPEIQAFSWNGDRFCLKRLNNFIRTSGACPNTYTKCGTLLCVPTGSPCPISDVQIVGESATVTAGYVSQPMTFERKLIYKNSDSSSNKQFAQFSYSTVEPCLDNNAFHARANGKTYILEIEERVYGCKQFGRDLEGKDLNSIEEGNFNLYNAINEQTVKDPGYDAVLTGSNVNLWARYRFETIDNDFCAQYYITNVKQFISDVEDFSYLYRGITIAGTAMGFITTMIALVYIRVLTRDGFWMINKEEPFGRRFIFQIVLLHTLYAVVTTILGNIALAKINSQESYLKEIESENCFKAQPLLNTAMDDVSTYLTNKIDGLVFLNNILVFIAGGTTIVVIINLLFRKQRKYDGNFAGQR